MSVKRAQEEIDSREFAYWMAFYRLEPWGRDVEDRPAAMIASIIANTKRPKGRQPYKLSDFQIQYDRKAQTLEEQMQIAKNMTVALGGSVH